MYFLSMFILQHHRYDSVFEHGPNCELESCILCHTNTLSLTLYGLLNHCLSTLYICITKSPKAVQSTLGKYKKLLLTLRYFPLFIGYLAVCLIG